MSSHSTPRSQPSPSLLIQPRPQVLPQASPSSMAAVPSSMLSSAASWVMTSVPHAISSVSSRYSAGAAAPSGPSFDRDLDRLFHGKIRPLLDAVDNLRGILREDHSIPLPTIVVAGDQSSGKSSVLEALSGVALPRGREITTRCPLVLRLINTAVDKDGNAVANDKKLKRRGDPEPLDADGQLVNAHDSKDPSPYAVISIVSPNIHDGDVIHNLADVGRHIEAATAKLAGRGVGVVSTPIYLSVFRHNSPDLTLVDLPGITRNPVGDQPKDIYKQIKDMIYQFIRPETAVILNVMPATVDFPTCECVMMSKEVDTEAIRTIAVVTKVDLGEKGIRRKLENGADQLNLHLGLVAVRNRNQDEIDRNISFEVSRQMEQQFFLSHPELAPLAGDYAERKRLSETDGVNGGLYLGTTNLAQLLTVIQEQRIRSTLPSIRQKVRDALQDYRTRYRELPSGNVSNGGEARGKIEHLINIAMDQIAAIVRGEHAAAKGDKRLHVSPRLSELYLQMQRDLASSCSNFFSGEYAAIVEEEVKENAGITLSNFLSSQIFKGLMHREAQKLKQPATNLLESSRAVIQHMIHTICRNVFHAYPTLANRVQALTSHFLDHRLMIVMDRLEEFLMQEEDVYTVNSYYLDTSHKIKHAIHERLGAIQQTSQQHGGSGTMKSIPATITIPVNDLSVTVHLADLVRHAEKRQQSMAFGNNRMEAPSPANGTSSVSSPASSAALASISGIQTLLNPIGSQTLEMQINAFAYTQIMHKRLCDALPLLIRFHLLRSLSQSPATPTSLSQTLNPSLSMQHASMSSLMQKEFMEMSDKLLLDAMKEEPIIANKREQLNKSIERMEKAMAVFEAL